jgi:hypothetical protein
VSPPLPGACDPSAPTSGAILDALAKVCPQIEREVRDSLDDTLASYARIAWASPLPERLSEEARAAWNDLIQELHATTQPLGPDRQRAVVRQFESAPVIQSGAHCQLLLDRYSFFSNLLFYMGARECNRRHLVTFQSTTNTLESSPGKGPGWLTAAGRRLNVFGLSRRVLQKTSVMRLAGPLSFALLASGPLEPATESYLRTLRQRFEGQPFPSAREAFAAMNASLWSDWGAANDTGHVWLDEDFATRVLIRHLKRGGLLASLLSSPRGRAGLALRANDITPDYRAFVPQGTEIFWDLTRSRIRAMRLQGSDLRGEDGATLSLQAEALIGRLQRGECVPSLFLQFLVLSILPRVRVTGGLRQCVYYTVFQQQILRLATLVDPSSDLVKDLSLNTLNHWGMRVIEEQWQPIDRLALGRIEDWETVRRDIGRVGLREAIHDLRIFNADSKWTQVLLRLNALRPG